MAAGFMAGAIVGKLLLDKSKWDAGINSVKKDEKTIGGFSSRSQAKFRGVGTAMTLAGGAIIAGLGGAVKAFGNFDQAMTESLSIMGDVSDDLKTQMKETAIEMSQESKFAAKDLGGAYFFLASAGMDAEQSIAALPVVMKFAQAGAFDLSRATDLLTDAQSALGLSSKNAAENQENMTKVSDVLVKANTLANASVSQFSEALTNKAGAAMRAYGIDLETGVATLAAFADQGVKGNYAGTQFAIVLRDLQKSAIENRGAFEQAGVAVYDASGNFNNMGTIIGQLEERLEGMSAEQKKVELSTLGFQEKSQMALLTLIGTSDKIKDYEKDLRSAGGITEEVSEKQLKSFNNQMAIAKNQVMAGALAIGEQLAPVVKDIAGKIGDVAKKFSAWAKANPKLFGTITKIVAVLGGLLLIFGPLVFMLPQMVAGVKLLGAAFKTALGPIGLITTAIMAAGYALNKWINARKKAMDAEMDAMVADKTLGSTLKLRRKLIEDNIMTQEEWRTLVNKHGKDYKAVMNAINTDPALANVKTALDDVTTAEGEAGEGAGALGTDMGGLEEDIKNLTGKMASVGKETKTWTDFLKDNSILTLEDKRKKVEELEGYLDDLETAYKAGKLSLEDYNDAQKIAHDEIVELGSASKTYYDYLKELGIPTIKEEAEIVEDIEEKQKALDTAYKDGKISLENYTTESKNLHDELVELNSSNKTYHDYLKDIGIPTVEEEVKIVKDIKEKQDALNTAYENGEISLKNYTAETDNLHDNLVKLGAANKTYYDYLKELGIPTEKGVKTAIADTLKKLDALKTAYKKGLIGPDKYNKLTADLQGTLTDLGSNIKIVADEIPQFWQDLAEGIGSIYGGLLWDLTDKTTTFSDVIDNFFKSWVDMFRGMISDMLKSWTTDFVTGIASGAETAGTAVADNLSTAIGGEGADDVAGAFDSVGKSAGGLLNTLSGVANIVTAVASVAALFKKPGGPSTTDSWNFEHIQINTKELRDYVFLNIGSNNGWLARILDKINSMHMRLGVHYERQGKIKDEIKKSKDYLNTIKNNAIAGIGLLESIRDNTKDTVVALKGTPGAQHGYTSRKTELVELHGTPQDPEHVIRDSDFSRLINVAPAAPSMNYNINVANNVTLAGKIITDREHTRDTLIPEIITALQANVGKRKIKEQLGIA